MSNNPLKYADPTGHMQSCEDGDICRNPNTNSNSTTGKGKHLLPHQENDRNLKLETSKLSQDDPPAYWDLNPLHPDYYTLTFSYAVGSVSFTVDRYAQAYWDFGGSLNTTDIGGPPGISLMAGRIGKGLGDRPPAPVLNPKDMSSFLTGLSGNGSVGLVAAGGVNLSPFSKAPSPVSPAGGYSTIAYDVGVSTPFAGGAVMYGLQFENEAVNNFAQNLMQNVIMPLLP